MILYRPVGLQELELIYDSGMKAFPARLPKQPIFYPVLQLEYARQTAASWNAKNGQLAGYVTEFRVDDEYIDRFEKHTIGKSQHQELWIPAEEMEEFNKHILGHIKLLEAHFGDSFEGFVPDQFGLQGKNAVEQFTLLANSYLYKRMDFYLELKRNHKAVFLNYPFWQAYGFKNPELKKKILQAIKEAWSTSFPKIPLPLSPPTHEELPPVKQTHAHAPRLVDPLEEEITPEEETDPWKSPFDEEAAFDEETDSDAPHWTDPVDEIKPTKQTQARAFVKPVPKEVTPEEEADSWTDPADEVNPINQTPARASKKSLDEEIAPEEETDEDAFTILEGEEIVHPEQITPPVWATPVHEETPPAKQIPAQAQPLMEPADEEITSLDDADALADLLDEEVASVGESDFHSLEELVEEETESLADLVDEDSTPVEQPPPSVLHPVRKESKPRERTASPIGVNPVHRENVSHLAQGVKLGLNEKYREAIEELSKAVEEDPDDVVAHTSLGVAFHRLHEDNHALDSYEGALKIDPKYAEAYYFRANLLYFHGYVREAIEGYTIAIGLDPELIEAHRRPFPQDRLTDYSNSLTGMYRIAKPAQRILNLNKLLKTNPRQAKLFKERAAEYSRLGNYEQAIADYSSFLAIQPNDANVLHSRGVAYEQMGQGDRAQEDYQKAIAINPQLSHLYINRGITFGKAGNFRQSIDSLTDAIRLAPRSPHGYFNRGTSYLQLGDLDHAIADFSKAIQYSSNDEDAYYWRGIAYEEAGRQDQAIADYRQFLQLSQDPRAKEEVERKLSQWNQGKQNGVRSQSVIPENRRTMNQVPLKKSDQNLDLQGLIVALGERALNSTWFGSGVRCYGEKAEELYTLTDQNKPIQGRDLLRITSGIRQTIEGDFTAFDPDAASHWIFIRAWDGSGFYIEIDDPKGKEQLRSQFPSVEEVEGASPPYEGLFIRI